MHILLTDVLTCPRCGPGFGLILLADRIEDRRVKVGRLGCPNCREQYRIGAGHVDLSGGVMAAAAADPAAAPSADRLSALLGVTQGPAYVLLAGTAADRAEGVRDALEDVEVIALVDAPAGSSEDEPGLSRVVCAGVPVATGKMSGVAVTGPRTAALMAEAARSVRPTGRLLLDPAPPGAADALSRLGLRVLAEEGTALLAVRG